MIHFGAAAGATAVQFLPLSTRALAMKPDAFAYSTKPRRKVAPLIRLCGVVER